LGSSDDEGRIDISNHHQLATQNAIESKLTQCDLINRLLTLAVIITNALLLTIHFLPMRFRTRGIFASETVIEIAQRLVALLQDADVARVCGLNIYLTTIDKKGAHRELTLDGHALEIADIDCTDLALSEPQSKLALAAAPNSPSAPTAPYRRKRRRA